MNKSKNQHHLPRFYLRAWADENDRVAMRRRGAEVEITNTVNVGVKSNSHSQEAELHLSRNESKAAKELTSLIQDSQAMSDWTTKRVLGKFLALQLVRTPDALSPLGLPDKKIIEFYYSDGSREALSKILKAEFGSNVTEEHIDEGHKLLNRYKDLNRESNRKDIEMSDDELLDHFRVSLKQGFLRTWRSESVMEKDRDRHVRKVQGLILRAGWKVYESPRARYITSDYSVFSYPQWFGQRPTWPSDSLCFVICPSKLFKLDVTGEDAILPTSDKEVHEINKYIAKHFNQQIISLVSDLGYLDRLQLDDYRPYPFAKGLPIIV